MKIALTLLAALLCGCAGPKAPTQTAQDRFTGKTILQTSSLEVPLGLSGSGSMTFDLRKEAVERGPAEYFVVIASRSLQGAVLHPSPYVDSLFVIADGRRFAFRYADQQGTSFIYPASLDQLRSIALADSVEVRIVQPNGLPFEMALSKKHRNALRDFAREHLKK